MKASRPGPCVLPESALLRRYREAGAYTDCYALDVAAPVAQATYVEAFYTTWVFKLERAILAAFVARRSTDAQARALAHGKVDGFAAWRVEARTENQLLLCDYRGRTCSWLMAAPIEGGTRLYFGSAVIPIVDARTGRQAMGGAFAALLGFHKAYSRVLLRAAAARLRRGPVGGA